MSRSKLDPRLFKREASRHKLVPAFKAGEFPRKAWIVTRQA
jgi:hypothetical protein